MTFLLWLGIGGLGLIVTALAAMAGYTAWSTARIERLIPPDGAFVEVEGARLHYVDEGQGPAIVIVHGLGGQLRNFRYALLSRLSPRFRVILVDRPGSGYSTFRGQFPGLRAQARAIAGLMDALGLERPLLVGHSLGGAVSLALAQDYPDRVRGLALIAPLTQGDLADVPKAFRMLAIRSPLARLLVAWLLVAPLSALAGPQRRSAVFAPDPVPDDFDILGGGGLTRRPKTFIAASRDLLLVPDELPGIQAAYETLRAPVEILFGRGDRILDPKAHGEGLARQIPGARLTLVDGGHMLPTLQAQLTADWLADVAARAPR